MIDTYENRSDNLDDICLAVLAVSYIYEKVHMNYEPDDEKTFIKPVVEIREEEDLKTAFTIKFLKMVWEK